MAPRSILGVAVVSLVGPVCTDGLFGTSPAPPPSFSDDLSWAPTLDFHDKPFRELSVDDLPVKTCTNQLRPASFWKQPFVSSRLRLRTDVTRIAFNWLNPATWLEGLSTFKLYQTFPERSFCKWLGLAGVDWLAWSCEDCSKKARPCLKAPQYGAHNGELMVDLPPEGEAACVWLDQLPKGATKMRVAWHQQIDLWVLARFLLGSVLVSYHLALRESTTLHALLGGIGMAVVTASVVAAWLLSTARGTVDQMGRSVPLGSLMTSATMFAFVMLPSLRQAFFSMFGASSTSDVMAWLSLRDPYYHLPIGWICFFIFLIVVYFGVYVGVQWSLLFFASAKEPEGEVGFLIRSDGSREDILPPSPRSQRCLGWVIWLIGLVLLLQSTHSDICSLALTQLVLHKDFLVNIIYHRLQSALVNEVAPDNLRRLISQAAYEDQAQRHTHMEMVKLQNYLQSSTVGKASMGRVRQDTELRVRRFADGVCNHFDQPDFIEPEQAPRCSLL